METRLPSDIDRPLEDFDKTLKRPLKQPLALKRQSVSKSAAFFFSHRRKILQRQRRLAGSRLTRQRLDRTNADDDAQKLYRNKSLTLILHDDDEDVAKYQNNHV